MTIRRSDAFHNIFCCNEVLVGVLKSYLKTVSLYSFSLHKNNRYENTPMQQTATFHGCNNGSFYLKYFDYFHNFAQNIDRVYALEPPQ